MALSTATITYDVSDQVGTDFDIRRTKVWVSTNIADGTVIDTVGNAIRVDTGQGTLAADGTGSVTVWTPGTGSNPDSWQTYVHLDYASPMDRTRKRRTFGPFTVTTAANLADLVEEQEVPAEYLTTVTAALQGYVDDAETAADEAEVDADRAEAAADLAVDISGIATPDAVIAAAINNGASLTRAAGDATYAHVVILSGAGIDPTGVAASTTALQAKIDANPRRHLHLPAGVYKFTNLTLGDGQTLSGEGWQDYRDRFTVLGHAEWLDDTNFGGTILRSTVTSGTAITIVDTEVNGGALQDLILIGPGSGTSHGVKVGSGSMSVVHPVFSNVKVGNFATGVETQLLNEASFYDLHIHGCTTGLILGDNTNQNAFYMLDLQRNVTGCRVNGTSFTNAFYSPIAQSNSGVGFVVRGVKTAFYNPYMENNTGGGIEITSDVNGTGWGNSIHDPWCNNASDSITIRSGATDCSVTGFGFQGTDGVIVNEANGTFLHGRFPNLTDTGYGTTIIDYQKAGTPFAAWASYTPTIGGGWSVGNGTLTGHFTKIGQTIHYSGKLVFGSTTGTAGTSPTFALPEESINNLGNCQAFITRSGANVYALAPKLGATTVTMYVDGVDGVLAFLTTTAPATWGTGDVLEFSGTYESVV